MDDVMQLATGRAASSTGRGCVQRCRLTGGTRLGWRPALHSLGSTVTCALAARGACPSTHGVPSPREAREFDQDVSAHAHRMVDLVDRASPTGRLSCHADSAGMALAACSGDDRDRFGERDHRSGDALGGRLDPRAGSGGWAGEGRRECVAFRLMKRLTPSSQREACPGLPGMAATWRQARMQPLEAWAPVHVEVSPGRWVLDLLHRRLLYCAARAIPG